MKKAIKLNVNSKVVELKVEPETTLLDVLREELGLTGTKRGCGRGECGACTVLLDGRPIPSCLTLACRARGNIVTIEGVMTDGRLDPIQQAFIDHDAIHCGYCTPGMILSAKALLGKKRSPTEQEVRYAIAGNLCRCTGYEPIVRAILSVSKVER